MATVRNAGPVAVTPVGLLAKRWMGLWPLSAMVVAPELLERNSGITPNEIKTDLNTRKRQQSLIAQMLRTAYNSDGVKP